MLPAKLRELRMGVRMAANRYKGQIDGSQLRRRDMSTPVENNWRHLVQLS